MRVRSTAFDFTQTIFFLNVFFLPLFFPFGVRRPHLSAHPARPRPASLMRDFYAMMTGNALYNLLIPVVRFSASFSCFASGTWCFALSGFAFPRLFDPRPARCQRLCEPCRDAPAVGPDVPLFRRSQRSPPHTSFTPAVHAHT